MSAIQFNPLRFAIVAAGIAAAASPIAASAASTSETEQLLAAAGFQAVPANTPARQSEMALLPKNRLIAQPRGQGFTYIYADPRGCNCLYMGDATDYSAYQKLALSNKISQRYADSAKGFGFDTLNWNSWGPYDGWGWQGLTFVRGGRGGGSGGHDGGPGRH